MNDLIDVICISDSESSEKSLVLLKQNAGAPEQPPLQESNMEPDVVTLSSVSHHSTERCPVTWTTSVKKSAEIANINFLTAEIFSSPSPMSKVTKWLKENARRYTTNSRPDDGIKNATDSEDIISNKSSVMVRQDYKKAEETLNILNMTNNTHQLNEQLDAAITAMSGATRLQNIAILKSEGLQKSLVSQHKIENDVMYNVSSLESQKKIELCEYLKLMNMNPKDKTSIEVHQNRRSSRVKHLAVLMEKKELERKLNNKSPKKKSCEKPSDSDSKDSSDNIKIQSTPSFGPKPTEEFKQSTRACKTPSKMKHVQTIADIRKTPWKYLQVPEVSTTSTSRLKKLEGRKSRNENLSEIKSKFANEENPELLTKKSFFQLCMDVENAKPLRNMRMRSIDSIHGSVSSKIGSEDIFNISFPKSVINLPNITSDFGEAMEKVISNSVNRQIKRPHNENRTNESRRGKRMKFGQNNSVSKSVRAHSKIHTERSKRLENKTNRKSLAQKRYIYPKIKHLNKLRSRGRLKTIRMTTVLLKDYNRKKRKSQPKTQVRKQKDFICTQLLQTEANVNETESKEDTDNSFENKDPLIKSTPNTIKRCLPNPEIWKNFTDEHKKAFIESIKFLKTKGGKVSTSFLQKISLLKDVEKETDNEDKEKMKSAYENPVLKNTVPVIESAKTIETEIEADMEKHNPTCEDMEVDRLMNNQQLKEKVAQKDNQSPDISEQSIVDKSRCSSKQSSSSSSGAPSAQSWLLQKTEQSEPVPSTSSRISEARSSKIEDLTRKAVQPEVVNISQIEQTSCEYVQLLSSDDTKMKSLHHCLTQPSKQKHFKGKNGSPTHQQNWEESFSTDKSPRNDRRMSQSHTIYLTNDNGPILNSYYIDFNLIIVQELEVGFWTQSALGSVLGAQDMWIPKGATRRMVLGNGCVSKESSEMVMSCDDSVVYIELWTKEHKSDKRERPVADIFVTIYLRLSRSRPDKKVLQLENIHGYATDVQYIVLKNSRSIIVSWTVNADSVSTTLVHCYYLSSNFQMVTSITEMQSVSHYISSLHNIEDCDSLILGFGEEKITLWDLEHGYIVATIDLVEIRPQPRIVWTKCDRGFLFTLHQVSDELLQLIAINSFDSTWKRLQMYKPDQEHKSLLGVCVENGLLVAFYEDGFACWSAQTADLVVEGPYEEDCVFLPYGKNIVVVLNNQVHVRNALEYLVTLCPSEDS